MRMRTQIMFKLPLLETTITQPQLNPIQYTLPFHSINTMALTNSTEKPLLSNAHLCQWAHGLRRPTSGPPRGRPLRRSNHPTSWAGHFPWPAPRSATPGGHLHIGWLWWGIGVFWGPTPGLGRPGGCVRREGACGLGLGLGLGRPAASPARWGTRVVLGVVVFHKHELATLSHRVEVVGKKNRVTRRQLAICGFYVLRYGRFVGAILLVQCFDCSQNHLEFTKTHSPYSSLAHNCWLFGKIKLLFSNNIKYYFPFFLANR